MALKVVFPKIFGRCNLVRYFSSDFQPDTTTGKLILYGDTASPPVRFVMMTAAILKVDLHFHQVDLFCGENKTEFYKKINPLQKVPALKVENQVITDSHAIALYLCRRFNDTVLYPNDIRERAKVEEMLFFNSGALFPVDSAIFTSFFAGKWPVDKEDAERWNTLLNYLENILSQHRYLAGENITLADLCCGATISSLSLLMSSSVKQHENVNRWMDDLNILPCFNINAEGLRRLNSFVTKMKEHLSIKKIR